MKVRVNDSIRAAIGYKKSTRHCAKTQSKLPLVIQYNMLLNDSIPAAVGYKKSRVGHPFFSKERSVLYKRTFRSFCSFLFFIKERSVLSVLFRSL